MKRISEGAFSPLLFISTRLVASLLAFGLVGCSFHKDPPLFTASGYVSDEGINRLWRLDDAEHHPMTLINVYSPYFGGDTLITRYEYQDGQLHLVKQTHGEDTTRGVTLRFDNEGQVSFMQRQLADARVKLSADDIERYKYQADKVLNLSRALRAGNVQLVQGRWNHGVITTCDGVSASPNLNIRTQVWLAKRAARANDKLSLAWLSAPEGDEILLAADQDFCRWEPKESDLK
ncbi:DUF1481 domain-containing protein [Rouxiella sp. Mn2063]|uniref:DUF1481 domain-containing protein n=1 Tax=Rouxiella sp. Mn2063 TaxID=3395262 RepID=UPI003BEDA312